MTLSTIGGPRRWREHGWLTDLAVETVGIEFDQPRLGYYLGPVRDDRAGIEIGAMRSQIKKLADLIPVASGMAERREALAKRALDAGHLITASTHWYAATQLWGLATYPIWENSAALLELHRRKRAAYLNWAQLVEHHVEEVEIPFRSASLPAYLHLPPGHDGQPVPLVIASDGMDAGREFIVAQAGDEHLRRGMAVLAFDGPGQSESATRGIFSTPEAWEEAATALVEWTRSRAEVDQTRVAVSGVSFGSYFMTLVAATRPDAFRGCAVQLPIFEPGCHTIFEVAGPSYKARHMWMAGLSHDEDGFDSMVRGYDLTRVIDRLAVPWQVIGGSADELSPIGWVDVLAERAPGPVSTLIYDDARHAMTQSPATVLGPPWRTESIDWLADAMRRDIDDHEFRVRRRVLRTGQIVDG